MAKIIITDDEPMNRRMTEFMLTKNGYETVKAASGEECLSKLSDGADLVLLDVMMPGLNGFETLKRMRGVGITIPVILQLRRITKRCMKRRNSVFHASGNPSDLTTF